MHLFHFENNWTLCILVLAIGVIIIRYHLASTQIIQIQHIFMILIMRIAYYLQRYTEYLYSKLYRVGRTGFALAQIIFIVLVNLLIFFIYNKIHQRYAKII